jgi:dual specificity phosphatase 10
MFDTKQTILKKHFKDCFDFIDDASQNGKVLVHCVAGVSRSASVVIAYLMNHQKMTLSDAFSFVQERRNKIFPNESFRKQLRQYEQDLFINK